MPAEVCRGRPARARRGGRAGANSTALGLLAGILLDQAVGDPRHAHPVATFGAVAARLERRLWRDSRLAGGAYAVALICPPAALGAVLGRTSGVARFIVTASVTWAALGSRSLVDEAYTVQEHLAREDLAEARQQLTHLVGRRTDSLNRGEIARATVESVAENTCDAVVAPLFWGAVAGLPGLLAYRAVNTLDAMVGHHSLRYERFGWAAARADDVANLVPARLTAALAATAAPLVGGSTRVAVAVARRDGRRHPSPNSGMSEAAFAGALGVRLGGRNDYGSRVEHRPVLNAQGQAPTVADIARAVRLSRAVTAAAALAVATTLLRRGAT